MDERLSLFEARAAQFAARRAAEQRRHNQLAVLRGAWFVAVLVVIYLSAEAASVGALVASVVLGGVGFVVLLVQHQRVGYR
ncbi:MAG: hypothetical protein WBA12_04385, partial [Catalinimonas sp.]